MNVSVGALAVFTAGLAVGQTSPPAFEVASIRPADPSAPAARLINGMSQEDFMQESMPASAIRLNGKQVSMRSRSLRSLIAAAYQVHTSRVLGPGWLSDVRFDIDAKIPEEASEKNAPAMLQALLADRFGLVFHKELREESGYSLVVGKGGSKLKESTPPPENPNTREMAEKMMAASQKKAQGRMRSVGYGRITMQKFAEALGSLVGGEVVDRTGLNGKYDIDMDLTPSAPDEAPAAAVFRAVEDLGLKLQGGNARVEKLIIDKVAKGPTPN